MKLFKPAAAVAAVASVALGGVLLAGPATADPVTEGYVLVGSDTLQDSVNALTNGTSVSGPTVRVASAGKYLGNFDAFPATGAGSLIRVKSSGPYFLRPSGSGNGLTALSKSISSTDNTWNGVNIKGQVDIARSSSGPAVDANGKVAYVPYARDAVAYAYTAQDADAATALAHLTATQLWAIYSSNSTTGVSVTANGKTTTVYPRIPQSGSGTRKFFLKALSGSETPALGAAVPTSDSATTPENDATVLTAASETGKNEIIPFSAASWFAQSSSAAPSTLSSSVHLGSPLSVEPLAGSPLAPNPTYYADGTWGRDVYLIVERARITPGDAKYDAALATLVDPSQGVKSLTAFGDNPPANQPGAVKLKFGFVKPSSTTVQFAVPNP